MGKDQVRGSLQCEMSSRLWTGSGHEEKNSTERSTSAAPQLSGPSGDGADGLLRATSQLMHRSKPALSFDDLVGEQLHRGGNHESKSLRGVQVDYQFKCGR